MRRLVVPVWALAGAAAVYAITSFATHQPDGALHVLVFAACVAACSRRV